MRAIKQAATISEVVPFLHVKGVRESLKFYCEGLEFELRLYWPSEEDLQWCRLTLGAASIMLQTTNNAAGPGAPDRISLCFMCDDALELYRRGLENGLNASEPFVGNNLWVVTFVDPDGNRIDFESPTDVPEGTRLSEWQPS